MMNSLDEAHRLKLSLPFAGIRVAGERHNPRIAYDPAFVRTRILPGTELGGVNAEAAAIVRMIAATGMRPSELVALTRERVVLDAPIPHVQVRADHRQLKNAHSERDMPLVGIALAIMRQFPDGFPRYRHTPDTLSATVNKALGAAGLRATPEHTLYSLRHTFKDRLIAIEAPERVQDADGSCGAGDQVRRGSVAAAAGRMDRPRLGLTSCAMARARASAVSAFSNAASSRSRRSKIGR
jgi:hypothetical protein